MKQTKTLEQDCCGLKLHIRSLSEQRMLAEGVTHFNIQNSDMNYVILFDLSSKIIVTIIVAVLLIVNIIII